MKSYLQRGKYFEIAFKVQFLVHAVTFTNLKLRNFEVVTLRF